MFCDLIKQYFNLRHGVKNFLDDREFSYVILELYPMIPAVDRNNPEFDGKLSFIYTQYSIYHAVHVEIIEDSEDYVIISLLYMNIMLKLKVIETQPTKKLLSLLGEYYDKHD